MRTAKYWGTSWCGKTRSAVEQRALAGCMDIRIESGARNGPVTRPGLSGQFPDLSTRATGFCRAFGGFSARRAALFSPALPPAPS